MAKKKELSSPFSTGGGGFNFEGQVQALHVTLMLTGGHAPCLSPWPIIEVNLQCKINGYETDDMVIIVEKADTKAQQKLLAQIKHSIAITKSNNLFQEVIQAAWNDFNNQNIFTQDKDIIALITGPLNKSDAEVTWLLNHARSHPEETFFNNINTAQFSSDVKRKKLEVLRYHLKIANGGDALKDKIFHRFLKHFYLIGYDLGEEEGTILSILTSHISQFTEAELARNLWGRVLEYTNNTNHHAGCITQNDIPSEIQEKFKQKHVAQIPEEFNIPQVNYKIDWAQHQDATYMALAVLIGAWDEKNENDIEVIVKLLEISYNDWRQKAQDILHFNDSPLSFKNGIWKVTNRTTLFNLLESRIFDKNIDTFKSLALKVIKQSNPLGLPAHSDVLRQGIAEGLAILSNQPSCTNCSSGKKEEPCQLIMNEIFTTSNWIFEDSLNNLLPIFSEAAPDKFLHVVEETLQLSPCPFDGLFSQEDTEALEKNCLTGLLWALEGLAWEEQYLVRVCVLFGDLANRDNGGQWLKHPSDSLIATLLPWIPQTLASIEKRKVAVETLLGEFPDVAWKLIIKLLPNSQQTSSFSSHRPKWKKVIPDNWSGNITHQEYWQQTSAYVELAVENAENDINRISELINHFHNLPQSSFDQFIKILTSSAISALPEEKRFLLWDPLTKLINKHRKLSDADWALSNKSIERIEKVAEYLAPTSLLVRHKPLFSSPDADLYEQENDWDAQAEILSARREKAMAEIFKKNGIEGIIQFVKSIASPWCAGRALGVIDDAVVEQFFLPDFLNITDEKHKYLVHGFISKKYQTKGEQWCDKINTSNWTIEQMSYFLACLPFTKVVWERASDWLKENEREYWSHANANPYQAEDKINLAIDKLIEYDRPYSAINCLYNNIRTLNQPTNIEQCINALLSAVDCTNETKYNNYQIVELIKFLQLAPLAPSEDIIKIEWAYILLSESNLATPKFLKNKLANDPDFFCEIVQIAYRSNEEKQSIKKLTSKEEESAFKADSLLKKWKTPPGLQKNQESSSFCAKHFNKWLQHVEDLCIKSGHWEIALGIIGTVLVYAPADPDGLWIHRAVAKALNRQDANDMRNGFRMESINLRGFYKVDPTGKPEKELAEKFRNKADEIENAGFQRFATTLRDLAKYYDKEATQIIEGSHLS